MIKRPSVLVLGAGASVEWDFPTGAGLVREILALLERSESRSRLARALSVNEEYLEQFHERLRDSGLSSIDEYLSANREKAIAGKTLIASIIGSAENAGLYGRDIWYRRIFQTMSEGAGLEELIRNRIAFITFNYDRSLEAFLFRAMKGKYGCSDSQAEAILNRIPIIHVYGQAGLLPWQKNPGKLPVREFGLGAIDVNDAQLCAGAIRTMGEGAQNEIRERAARFLRHAESIYFLGFGYSRFNLRQLQFEAKGHLLEVMGTHYPKDIRIPVRFTQAENNGFGRNISIVSSNIDEFLYAHAHHLYEDSYRSEGFSWDTSMDFEESVARADRYIVVEERREATGEYDPFRELETDR